MKCGLLGEKLGHSYSPQIHSHLGSYSYELFEKKPEELAEFLKNGDFSGLNVTIPYKKAVIEYCDELSPRAKSLGAVNTIVRRTDGSLIGHNTDFFGFDLMVSSSGLDVKGKKALVLGSGGASNTAAALLEEKGANVVIISRKGQNNYQNLDLHADASLIVNATPVGMYPNVGVSPLNLDLFPKLEGVLDLLFNPSRSKLLLDAEKRGIVAVNGLLMLVAQAKESAEWFTGCAIPDETIPSIHKALKNQMENIVLIGMPGCGKSTIGQALAARLNRKFLDADLEIACAAGMDIPKIFAEKGENGFRELETKVLSDLGKRSGLVIATGGGCITREANYPLLHQNSKIFWIQRDINCLPTDGRPLSRAGKLHEMYQIRKPMYEKFADAIVQNDSTIDTVLNAILAEMEVTE